MGYTDQDPRAKCSDLDLMERPRDAKRKGGLGNGEWKSRWRRARDVIGKGKSELANNIFCINALT